MAKATYKDAGVDLEVYQQSMSRLPRLLRRTHNPRVIGLEGGFAGLFQLDFDNKLFARNYQNPVMVSCSDGVGTKLKVAQMVGRHDTVGIDLVAMSVNDAICCGAEPLFFLDYIAMSHDDPDRLEQIVEGISDGCMQSGCALLGGETAIMPDIYARDDYDLAGFVVGVVERNRLIDGKAVSEGDVLIGVASDGLHSNGFSLVRKVVFENSGLGVDDTIEALGCTIGEELLRPTRIYANSARDIMQHETTKSRLHGVAHITGGGLQENIDRILPVGLRAVVRANSWNVPPVFDWLGQLGQIDDDEMARVFNMGIGLVMVVGEYDAQQVMRQLTDSGETCWVIGQIDRE